MRVRGADALRDAGSRARGRRAPGEGLVDSGAACAHQAFLYATGKVVVKNVKTAAALYKKSCELGDPQGCYNAGLMADEGRGVKEDVARAAADYAEGCDLGSANACTNLGFLYERGKGVRQDKARAVELYQRGCDGTSCSASNLGGCVNVGRAYRDGIGVEKNEEKAAQIFRAACDREKNEDDVHAAENGARACSLLGGLYIAGEGIPKDPEHGRDFSIQGCDRGDAFGCFNAAVTYSYGAGSDPAKAVSCFEARVPARRRELPRARPRVPEGQRRRQGRQAREGAGQEGVRPRLRRRVPETAKEEVGEGLAPSPCTPELAACRRLIRTGGGAARALVLHVVRRPRAR